MDEKNGGGGGEKKCDVGRKAHLICDLVKSFTERIVIKKPCRDEQPFDKFICLINENTYLNRRFEK